MYVSKCMCVCQATPNQCSCLYVYIYIYIYIYIYTYLRQPVFTFYAANVTRKSRNMQPMLTSLKMSI